MNTHYDPNREDHPDSIQRNKDYEKRLELCLEARAEERARLARSTKPLNNALEVLLNQRDKQEMYKT